MAKTKLIHRQAILDKMTQSVEPTYACMEPGNVTTEDEPTELAPQRQDRKAKRAKITFAPLDASGMKKIDLDEDKDVCIDILRAKRQELPQSPLIKFVDKDGEDFEHNQCDYCFQCENCAHHRGLELCKFCERCIECIKIENDEAYIVDEYEAGLTDENDSETDCTICTQCHRFNEALKLKSMSDFIREGKKLNKKLAVSLDPKGNVRIETAN